MIYLSPELDVKVRNGVNKPLELYELLLDSGTLYYSTERIVWGGNTYLAKVATRSDIRKFKGGEFDRFSVTFSNVDTQMAQVVLGNEIEGRRIIVRRIDRDIAGDSQVLFHGRMQRPSAIDEDVCTIEALELIGSIDDEGPSRQFTVGCAVDFKGRACGYTGSETDCDKSWARCSQLANTRHFSGFRFMPHIGSLQYQEVDKGRYLLLQNRKAKNAITVNFATVDDTPYDVPVPICIGRVQIAGLVIQHEDIGAVTKALAVFCVGPIAQIIYIQANQSLVGDAVQHLGQEGGTGYQIVDTHFPAGYEYNRVAYVGLAIPSDVKTVDAAPEIRGTVLGAVMDLLGSDGSVLSQAWSDNPVLGVRYFMTLPIDEGGMGIPASDINDLVSFDAANYCEEHIPDSTNDQKIYLPSNLPSNLVVGADYRRFQSTGVVAQSPIVDGPYFDFDSADNDTSTSPAAVTVKRFTMNLSLAKAEKKVDILYKKMFPTFRGYLNYDKDGKICIRSERAVENSTLAAAASVGAQSVTVASAVFGPGMSILLSPFTTQAESRTIDSVSGGTLHLTQPLGFPHASGDAVYRIQMAFDAKNIRTDAKVNYPVSDRQSSVNQLRVKYIDSPAGFESRTLQVNDYENQKSTHKLNAEELDGSGIDSYFQAWRIGEWQLAKYRDLAKYIEIPAGISASLLEIGDVFCASAPEFGLQAVPFEVIEIGISENDECTVVGQLYDIAVYDDTAPQTTVSVPSVFAPITPGAPGSTPAPDPVTSLTASAQKDATTGKARFTALVTPPADMSNLEKFHAYAECPDFSGVAAFQLGTSALGSAGLQGTRIDLKTVAVPPKDADGKMTLVFDSDVLLPKNGMEVWRVYVATASAKYDPEVVPASHSNSTPSVAFNVYPDAGFGLGEEFAPRVSPVPPDSIPVKIETRFGQSGWEYLVTVGPWEDPTADTSDRYRDFAGVHVLVQQYGSILIPGGILGFGRNLIFPTGVKTYEVGPGRQMWTSPDWASIPAVQETHTGDVLSVDREGRVNSFSASVTPQFSYVTPDLDALRRGGGTGKGVQASALSDATDFSITAGYGYDTSGGFEFIVDPRFTVPIDAAIGYFGLVIERPLGSGQFYLPEYPSIGDGVTDADKWYLSRDIFPRTVETWGARLITYDTNNNPKYPDAENLPALRAAGIAPDFGTSPSCTFNVEPQAAASTVPDRYAELVTVYSGGVFYEDGTGGDGVGQFGFQGSWAQPIGDRYQGIVPTVIYDAAPGQQIPLCIRGKDDLGFKTATWPVNGTVIGTLYFLSQDASGRTNPIVIGATPAVSFTVTLGAGKLKGGRIDRTSLGRGVKITDANQLDARVDNQSLVFTDAGIAANLDNTSLYIKPTGAVGIKSVARQDLVDAIVDSTKMAVGAIDDYNKFITGLRPYEVVSSLPTNFTRYSVGAAVILSSDYQLYRSTGSGWTTSVPGSSVSVDTAFVNRLQVVGIIANSVISTWAYLGYLDAGHVNAGQFTGCSLVFNNNGVTTSITNSADGYGGYGIKVASNTGAQTAFLSPGLFSMLYGNVVVQIQSFGGVISTTVFNSSGLAVSSAVLRSDGTMALKSGTNALNVTPTLMQMYSTTGSGANTTIQPGAISLTNSAGVTRSL